MRILCTPKSELINRVAQCALFATREAQRSLCRVGGCGSALGDHG